MGSELAADHDAGLGPRPSLVDGLPRAAEERSVGGLQRDLSPRVVATNSRMVGRWGPLSVIWRAIRRETSSTTRWAAACSLTTSRLTASAMSTKGATERSSISGSPYSSAAATSRSEQWGRLAGRLQGQGSDMPRRKAADVVLLLLRRQGQERLPSNT